MKRIKVAHVLDSVGGVEVYLRLVIENINTDKVENIIIHNCNKGKKGYYDKGNNSIAEFNINIQREISPINDFKAIYKTIKILKRERPDVIHAHSAKGGIIARVASLFYKVNVLHTPHAYSHLSTQNNIVKYVYLTLERFFRSFNSILLATSVSEQNVGIRDVGYRLEDTEVFSNSILPINEKEVDTSVFDTLNLPSKYICTVGRPSYQKNIEFMLDVINEVKRDVDDVHLVIMGVGEYSPNVKSVQKKIEYYRLNNNVTMVKWVDRKAIFSIIKESMLYLSTARYEGLPYSVIESLAMSKACVVSDCDGNVDLVENEINGYVVEQNNLSEFSKRVKEIYLNEEIRRKFEKASGRLFFENFNLEDNIHLMEDIYAKYSKKS